MKRSCAVQTLPPRPVESLRLVEEEEDDDDDDDDAEEELSASP